MPERSGSSEALLLRAARIGGRPRPVDLLIVRGKIAGIGSISRASRRGATTIDLEGRRLVPGFVDVHTHGAAGVDFVHADASDFAIAMDHYLAHGVTSILVSLYPERRKDAIATVRRIAGFIAGGIGRRVAAGIHLEGPFVNPGKPGALPRARFRAPSIRDMGALLDAGAGLVRTVTIAPELSGGEDLARFLARRGVVAAFGHSLADYEQTKHAIERAGIRYATHLFNAMSGLHHRGVGAVGALLEHAGVAVELISDGHHVSIPAMRLAQRLKPQDKVILVSDSAHPCGLRDGRYDFAGTTVRLRRGTIRLEDGTLAGSALSLDEALRVQVERVGTPFDATVLALTENPARAVGFGRQSGRIAPRRSADLAVIDERLRVVATLKAGVLVHRDATFPAPRR